MLQVRLELQGEMFTYLIPRTGMIFQTILENRRRSLVSNKVLESIC